LCIFLHAPQVYEHLVAGFVLLAQHHIQTLPLLLIALAKPAVAISLRMCLPVFFPHQLQRQGDAVAVAHESPSRLNPRSMRSFRDLVLFATGMTLS